MIQVAEIIYVVPAEREAFKKNHLEPTQEQLEVLWTYGIRNLHFYQLNDLLLETFDYVGANFHQDMTELTKHPKMQGFFIPTRRKNVPADKLDSTNWWAPVKKIAGKVLTENPIKQDKVYTPEEYYRSMVNGITFEAVEEPDISFDGDDWSESIHI